MACVIWAAPLPQGPLAEQAQRFVDQGGTLILLPPGMEQKAEAGFLGMGWGAPEESATNQFFIVGSWDRDDGLLRDGLDGTPLATDTLRGERGVAWFIGTLPDYRWSNLGDGDLLLPAIQRGILAGADRFDSGHLATVGTKQAAALPGETRTRVDDYGAPDPANAIHEAGVWKIDSRLVAANRPPTEDRVEQLERETLDQVLSGTNYSLFQEARSQEVDKLFREAWRAFLLAMLFFLFGEALLCLPAKPSEESATDPSTPSPAR